MLNASDFRTIYTKGVLPEGKTLLSAEEIQNNSKGNDKISREWISIEKRIYSLAKSLLDKSTPITLPPEFCLWIERKENLKKLTNVFDFRAKYAGEHAYDYNYLISFL